MRLHRLLALVILSLLLIMSALAPLRGQDETIITIGTPSWMSDVFRGELFDAFEAEHPGVKVVIVSLPDDAYYAPAGVDIEKHLEGAEKYASYADVDYVYNYNVSLEATRAGAFLNLAPLINSDSNFDTDDFFTPVWQSVQWDDGIWYIPASASTQMLTYDQKAFDRAGLPYPDPKWTFDDLARTARALTIRDQDGKVEIPGIQIYNPALFYYGISGHAFYDPGVSPSVPKFDYPDLPAFLEQWKSLQKDMSTSGQYDYNKIPMMLSQPWQLISPNPNSEQQWAASLLPGNIAGLDIQGFAVSGGTLNPELAYALADFASTNPQIIARIFGNTPARRSMVGVKVEDSTISFPQVSPEVQALIENALEHAVPTSELRFQDYVDAAINKEGVGDSAADIQAALQQAELDATKGLQTAEGRRSTTTVYVLTPVPTPSFGDNQIVLHFGLGADISSNRDRWNQIISDFLAANPSVGNVDLLTQFYQQRDLDTLDCYYQPYNQVPSMNIENFLAFDPFMDADPTFDRNDFIGTALEQVQREDHIWAYPMVLQPSVLWYNPDLFKKAGLPSPESGWTVDAFKDALEKLRGVVEKPSDPVFIPGTYGNTYLLLLMAAYGGVPYDYRTTPPTINFADPAAADAIRQVLDLAKGGYIKYQQLITNGATMVMGGPGGPITDDTLSTFSWRMQNRSNPDNPDPSRLANFPRGSQLTPVAYGVGAAYIQSHAQSPDACYAWIAELAKHPDLLGGMPARLSQIDDPAITASQGDDVSAVYHDLVNLFQQPNVIAFPGQFSDIDFNNYVEPLWLNKAFDNYVLHDGDLEKALADAETYAKAYRDCASPIPKVDPRQMTTPEESKAYYKQFVECAVKIDPSMKELFSYYYEDTSTQ